jgi:hypothetical protein
MVFQFFSTWTLQSYPNQCSIKRSSFENQHASSFLAQRWGNEVSTPALTRRLNIVSLWTPLCVFRCISMCSFHLVFVPGHTLSRNNFFPPKVFLGCLHHLLLQSFVIKLQPIPSACALLILCIFDALDLFYHRAMPKHRCKVGRNWVFMRAQKKVERWDRWTFFDASS